MPRRIGRSSWMLAAFVPLAACATPTRYQPLTDHGSASGGYTEQRLEDDRYRVAFVGNEATSRRRVQTYLTYRAAQLTLDAGYDGFTMVRGGLDRTVNLNAYVPPYPALAEKFEPVGGSGSYVSTLDSFEATGEIRMFHGTRPGDPRSFDAHRVIADLGPAIQMPR